MSDNIKILGLGFVNTYLIKTEKGFILIDAGVEKQGEKLTSMMTAAGCGTGDLKLVLITHGDRDHIGFCEEMKKKYNVPIAMHRGDFEMSLSEIKPRRKAKTLLFKIIMSISYMFASKTEEELFTPDLFLEDGQSFLDYGWDAKVIYTPGHSKGSICILSKEGALFAGDTFTNMSKPSTAQLIENEEELKASLALIGSLDVKMVYPGHGKPFSGEIMKKLLTLS